MSNCIFLVIIVVTEYLADYRVPVSEVPGRQHLRSARCHQLSVPRVHRNKFGTRAFSVAGPAVRSSLPGHLRWPAVGSERFGPDLKTYLFAVLYRGVKVKVKVNMDLYSPLWTHLRSGMARVVKGSHSFTCTNCVYPLTEWTIYTP